MTEAMRHGESLELDFKGHTIRALMVSGVPWFCLRDIVDALGWHGETMAEVDKPGFPSWAKMEALEDPKGQSNDTVLLSPTGVFLWGSFVDEWKSQAISAWAKRESRRLCQSPAPGDRAMFLTIIEHEDGSKSLPPYAQRYSGWKLDREDLRYSNEWFEAERHNHALSLAQSAERPKRNGRGSDMVGEMKRKYLSKRRQPIGLVAPERKAMQAV